MKEYIKKFKENTPEYDITYIPWIATVETTKQNLSTNRNYCMTIQSDDKLKVVRKTVVKRLKDVIDILDIRGTLTSDSIQNVSDVIEIEIGDAVTSIEENIFQNCESLTFIYIPNSVISIGTKAFVGCSGLTSIDIPNSVTSIKDGAFAYCSGLTSIDIPNGVTNIEENTFEYCTGLTSVTIPNSVTNIVSGAFSYCTGLTSVTCKALIPPTIQSTTWNNVPKDIPLYVPADSVSLYRKAEYWNEFTNIQAIH